MIFIIILQITFIAQTFVLLITKNKNHPKTTHTLMHGRAPPLFIIKGGRNEYF